MITLQHTALYFMALHNKRKSNIMSEFTSEVPFVLFPDAIRAYIVPRKAGHFELSDDGTKCSWMCYPNEETIKILTKENAGSMIQHYIVPDTPKCIIGERTDIKEFDIRNWGHRHYHSLRVHMLQDCVMDSILRDKMVDVTDRFNDKFVLRHDRRVMINGGVVREQITNFEMLGFIKLVEAVYRTTGVLLNREWYDQYVLSTLLKAYPEDLAVNTYKFMKMSDELNDRINEKCFGLTEGEKASIITTDKPERLMDEMYAEAYQKTWYEL